MNNGSEARESQECASKHPQGTLGSTVKTKPSDMETCVVMFIVLLIAGSITNVVYEVIFATGSPADTIHSIITDMWRAPVIAFYVTLTAAGIAKPVGSLSRRLHQFLSKSAGQ